MASLEFLEKGDYFFQWQVFDSGLIPFPAVVALRTSEHGDFISDIYMPGQAVNGSVVLTVMAGEIISLVNVSKKVLQMPSNMPPVYMSLVIHSIDSSEFTGPTGPMDIQGPTGIQGPIGSVGPIGIQGPIGSVGPTGIQGPTGSVGPKGIQGPTGSIGPQVFKVLPVQSAPRVFKVLPVPLALLAFKVPPVQSAPRVFKAPRERMVITEYPLEGNTGLFYLTTNLSASTQVPIGYEDKLSIVSTTLDLQLSANPDVLTINRPIAYVSAHAAGPTITITAPGGYSTSLLQNVASVSASNYYGGVTWNQELSPINRNTFTIHDTGFYYVSINGALKCLTGNVPTIPSCQIALFLYDKATDSIIRNSLVGSGNYVNFIASETVYFNLNTVLNLYSLPAEDLEVTLAIRPISDISFNIISASVTFLLIDK